MVESSDLRNIFKDYASSRTVFKDKDQLSTSFTPENIPHRDDQIRTIALMLAPVLRGEKPSNIFIYGKTGTGKTLVMRNIISQLEEAVGKSGARLRIIYTNCKMQKITDTEYRLLAQLIGEFGETVPYTGLPTNELYKKLFVHLGAHGGNVIMVLDEVDSLISKIGDDVLYNLTRLDQDVGGTKLTIIGISNNLSFLESLDPRVRSSLSEEEVVFPPYNANQLRDILSIRSERAFNKGSAGMGVIAKCAALAAQEHGDARKALDLLRVAGELAERAGQAAVTEGHVDMAQKKLDTDRFMEAVKSQPRQSQAVLKAILGLRGPGIQTGEVYDSYCGIARQASMAPLTQRRVSDLISELENFGIISTAVKSKGRYGRTRLINVALSDELVKRMGDALARELG